MKDAKQRWRKISLLCLVILLASTISVGMIAGYFPSSDSIPLEVKEPLELSSYPISFSLFPGETVEFNVTIQNMASVNYSVSLDFSLNDTAYQTEYVTFSDTTYTVTPGEQTLTAWLKVAPEAPTGNFLVTISAVRKSEEAPTPQSSTEPSPTPSPESPIELSSKPLLELLGSGARWAAGDGNSALVINWKDTYEAHHLTDGAEWGPWPDEWKMENWSQSILQTLEQKGFSTATAGDIPENLSSYDLVLIHAYYAVEPKHAALLRDYVSNGGSVVIIAGVPCYLNVYCKDMWPGSSTLPDWVGGGYYVNAGGNVTVTVGNPFDTSLLAGDNVLYTSSYSCAGVSSPTNNGQIIAQWNTGYTYYNEFEQEFTSEFDQGYAFAFTNEFGQGKVYYQALF
jgi:hypothetical protein